MESEARLRVAHNEAIFREVNERIQGRSESRLDPNEVISFVCECGDRECHAMVELAPEDYETVRRDATHFLVLPGHEIPTAETVIERGETYFVVEKLYPDARAEVQRTDPRS